MTYDVYAMFPEGAYLVASGNAQEHATDMGERACKTLGQWPHAIATIIRGEHVLNCEKFTFAQLKARG